MDAVRFFIGIIWPMYENYLPLLQASRIRMSVALVTFIGV
jgi:hypothetical protein